MYPPMNARTIVNYWASLKDDKREAVGEFLINSYDVTKVRNP